MDIFLRNFSVSSTEKELNAYIKPYLNQLSVYRYYFQKIKGKGCAILTVADLEKAKVFISQHGYLQDPLPGQKPLIPLYYHRRMLHFTPSRNAPKDVDIRALQLDEKDRLEKLRHAQNGAQQPMKRTFDTMNTYCGYWTFSGSQLVFSPQYHDERRGTLLFGADSIVLILKSLGALDSDHRMDISYHAIESVVLGHPSDPSITFALQVAPKFYELSNVTDQLSSLALGGRSQQRQPLKTRLESLDPLHSRMVGCCFVYRVKLARSEDINTVSRVLKGNRKVLSHVSMTTSVEPPRLPFSTQLSNLESALQDEQKSGSMQFRVAFQMQRLVSNGYLPPIVVTQLLPRVRVLCKSHGPAVVSEAIRRFSALLDYPGPGVDGRQFQMKQLLKSIEDRIETFKMEYSMFDIQKKHQHLVLVHRAIITPTGMYLDGPDLEVSNRVLRQYAAHSDYFIRVVFADEDGAPLHYDSRTSNERIYSKKFQDVLRNSIHIAGRYYRFLGFSHSSLRSQTCWFCAPFVQDGNIIYAPIIIHGLGDFTKIRSPARCAARIGQAFSDTSGSIQIEPEDLHALKDVKHNGRVFSDGCGTISKQLLKKVWKGWAASRNFLPSVLQIRFQGVKGLVSLDSRLEGEKICIRESMQKFEGSPSWDVEMCGANFKALSCFLNRQYIKILEDLGIPTGVFLRLQRERVRELKLMTSSTVNASQLLEFNDVGGAAHLPALIRILGYIGVQIQTDRFLWGVIQVTTLSMLRQLKYRSRILLEKGVTLYGIMDETGYLQEGEIFCVFDQKNGRNSVLTGEKVVVTRAPALHPGDVQVVTAVKAPPDSPLWSLHNCVVFSQHGERDLPSMLSGGDLDGDFYNVIWDPALIPRTTFEPADYPRVAPLDIGREVTSEDMSDFLLTFMKTDRLGQISNMHVQFADRYQEGILHSDCIKLAQLASTAVDFSKTGIPVNVTEIPKYDLTKPDFMAPGPRIHIDRDKAIIAERSYENDDDEDVVNALDEENRKPRYYESVKALGVLFRDIDERQFLEEIELLGRQQSNALGDGNMVRKLLAYVKREALNVQWEQYRPLARQLRETYEYNVAESMHSASPNLQQPVSEVEVFSGQVLGNSSGFQSRRSREYMMAMREEFNRHVAHTVEGIRTDDEGYTDEALPRAIACLAIGVEEEGLHVRKVGYLKSWKYVAAAVCLEELERFIPNGIFRKMM